MVGPEPNAPKDFLPGALFRVRPFSSLTALVNKLAVTAGCIAAAVLLLLPLQPAAAESDITTKMELFNSVQRSADGRWLHSGGGSATLKIDQLGNRNVRSSFELSALILPNNTGVDSLQTVSRAYGKFRFESFRGVIGKAPFSWGEGLIFNAADEIFGSGTGADLMQQEFEDPAAWISSLSYYFGPFSFVELLVNPGLLEAATTDGEKSDDGGLLGAAGSDGAAASPIEETRAGVRFLAKPGGIKPEGGYLFDGRDGLTESPAASSLQEGDFFHRIYLSLQG
ncbi:MAG: hypothetical protein R6V67_02195, partial [Spirochaetia bacterium]